MQKIIDANEVAKRLEALNFQADDATLARIEAECTRMRGETPAEAIGLSSDPVALRETSSGYTIVSLTKDGEKPIYMLGSAVTSMAALDEIKAHINAHNSLVVA